MSETAVSGSHPGETCPAGTQGKEKAAPDAGRGLDCLPGLVRGSDVFGQRGGVVTGAGHMGNHQAEPDENDADQRPDRECREQPGPKYQNRDHRRDESHESAGNHQNHRHHCHPFPIRESQD